MKPGQSLARRWSATTAPYLALKGIGQGLEFLGWVVLARRLGAEPFGVLAVATLVCRYGGLIADWGASISGVRDVAQGQRPGVVRALERRRWETALPLAALYLIGAWLSGHANLMMLVTVLLSIGLNRDWISLGQERGGRSALPIFAQGMVLLAIATLGSTSQPAIAVAVAYALSLILSLALNRMPKAPAGKYRIQGWMLLAILSNQVLSTADTFLLATLASVSLAGIYSAVYRLPNGWLALLVILRGGLLPLATTTLRDDPKQFLRLRRSSLRLSAIGGASLIAAAPLAFVAIPLVLGPAYRSGRWPAVLLLVATAIATAAAPLHHLYLAFGDDRSYGWYLLSAAVLNVALNIALIPLAGMMGAAVATLAANAYLAGALWLTLQRRVGAIMAGDTGEVGAAGVVRPTS
ncbi:MAG: polysaccharide biosynthesis C-terminal domain-containing protein [Actinomycetota bacterium]|nr:polysaccharide biosynthesis C-terminal domain-containing protein [Actinomycetota bacterium]